MQAISRRTLLSLCPTVLLALVCLPAATAQTPPPATVHVDWTKTRPLRTTPTLQLVVNPAMEPGGKLHDPAFNALKQLGADYVRYVPWLPYPRLAVAELEPPHDGKTSWDFSLLDPAVEDLMRAQAGHSVIMNFSTMPAWMWKTPKPVTYPADPNQVDWHYTQGTEPRDPSMKEVADYYARLLSWYEKGGFTDEFGKWHSSGHHYKFTYWEVLNEVDFEHNFSPELYTKLYDAVTAAMSKVDPDLKFVGLALANPRNNPSMFEYFLNPANHRPGAPLDFISYHFYAQPAIEQGPADWQYTFFDQANDFLTAVRFIEEIRTRLSPATKTDLDEIGVILPGDGIEHSRPGYATPDPPPAYWNAAAAMYAYLYVECAKLGIDVIGESQLVGYHSQFPSVSMLNYNTGEPNARFRVLQLISRSLSPDETLAATSATGRDITAQAFQSPSGRKLLLINKRNRTAQVTLPAGAVARITYVAPSTGDNEPKSTSMDAKGGTDAMNKKAGQVLTLEPFEVAVIDYR